jgi:hypothetical protein
VLSGDLDGLIYVAGGPGGILIDWPVHIQSSGSRNRLRDALRNISMNGCRDIDVTYSSNSLEQTVTYNVTIKCPSATPFPIV